MRMLTIAVLAVAAYGCTTPAPRTDVVALTAQVRQTEQAFAATMAARDHVGFVSFLADEAVFLNGGKPLRGKQAIAEHWKRFYSAAAAPFSWEPEIVEVLPSGTLAHTNGPVRDPRGKLIARFHSTWRLEPNGEWRVIFDDGCDICEPCANAAK
jgi:ketosteroid isomerase-like protein